MHVLVVRLLFFEIVVIDIAIVSVFGCIATVGVLIVCDIALV